MLSLVTTSRGQAGPGCPDKGFGPRPVPEEHRRVAAVAHAQASPAPARACAARAVISSAPPDLGAQDVRGRRSGGPARPATVNALVRVDPPSSTPGPRLRQPLEARIDRRARPRPGAPAAATARAGRSLARVTIGSAQPVVGHGRPRGSKAAGSGGGWMWAQHHRACGCGRRNASAARAPRARPAVTSTCGHGGARRPSISEDAPPG